jgi:Ca2+-binding EF-hand superfamily protein
MIDTANMGIMANLIQPASTNISSQMISKKDSNSDSSLSVKEMGVSNNIFSSYDSNSNGLVSKSELTTAIETAMSQYNGTMPSKEDFQSMLSSFGFTTPSSTSNTSSTASSQAKTISSILSNFDASNLSTSDAKSIVSAFKDAGITPSEELANLMKDAGFDAKKVGTLAGVGQQGSQGMAPSSNGGNGQVSSTDSTQTYDTMDTNKDGVVSLAELQAAYSSSSASGTNSTTSLTANQQNALDNLGVLMDVLKSNSTSTDGSSSVDTKSFDGILKAINSQNNNSQINTYLQSSNTSSLFGYA